MERLYQKDVYLQECQAFVREAEQKGDRWDLRLDRTLFFPEGGGQSADGGSIEGSEVIDVKNRAGDIIHTVKDGATIFYPGMQVHLVLDWAKRFDNMQRHLGEHILSGAIHTLYRGMNKGFHMGKDWMTIDIAFAPSSPYDKISPEMAAEAEYLANQTVWRDLPVRVRHFDRREEAEKMPLRKALSLDRDISIVTVGDEKQPADCVACCGTHPSSTGQVGLIKIHKTEASKGMTRIYFEAGERAYRACQAAYQSLSLIADHMSVSLTDVERTYRLQKEKEETIREKAARLTKKILAEEGDSLAKAFARGERNAVRAYEILSADEISLIGRELAGHIPGFLFLKQVPSLTLVFFSDQANCGALIGEYKSRFACRGGGSKTFGRVIFEKERDMQSFIDLLSAL